MDGIVMAAIPLERVAGTASQEIASQSVPNSATDAVCLVSTPDAHDHCTTLPPPSTSISPSSFQFHPSTAHSQHATPFFATTALNSTPLSPDMTDLALFTVSGTTFPGGSGSSCPTFAIAPLLPIVPGESGTTFARFAEVEKEGDVSMDCDFSKSAEMTEQVEFRESPPVSIHAEASSNGLSESHRQSQSKLRPHQISHPGFTPHSRSPGSEAEEVRAVEMVGYELMYAVKELPQDRRVRLRQQRHRS